MIFSKKSKLYSVVFSLVPWDPIRMRCVMCACVYRGWGGVGGGGGVNSKKVFFEILNSKFSRGLIFANRLFSKISRGLIFANEARSTRKLIHAKINPRENLSN